MSDIDHINGIKSDNKIVNLRLADYSQNGHNSKTSKTRVRQAPRGVQILRKKGRTYFYARISVNRKYINLGRFNSIAEAEQAYIEGSKRLLGEFSPYWKKG